MIWSEGWQLPDAVPHYSNELAECLQPPIPYLTLPSGWQALRPAQR